MIYRGASKSGFFEVRLPSLRHKRPCETYAPMKVSGNINPLTEVRGLLKAPYSFSEIPRKARQPAPAQPRTLGGTTCLCVHVISLSLYIYIYIYMYLSLSLSIYLSLYLYIYIYI